MRIVENKLIVKIGFCKTVIYRSWHLCVLSQFMKKYWMTKRNKLKQTNCNEKGGTKRQCHRLLAYF